MEKDIKREFYDGILREEYEFLTENNLRGDFHMVIFITL